MRWINFLLVLVLASLAPPALARGGDLDATFAAGGILRLDAGPLPDFGMAISGDGRFVTSEYRNGFSRLRRWLADGTADPAFAQGGEVVLPAPGAVRAMAFDDRGRIVLSGAGGYALGYAPPVPWFFARLRQDGSVDTTFGVGGWRSVDMPLAADMTVPALRVLDDGRIVAVAFPYGFEAGSASGTMAIARLEGDGALDPGYGVGGLLRSAFDYRWRHVPEAVRVLRDGGVELVRVSDNLLFKYRMAADGASVTSRWTPLPFPLGLHSKLSVLDDGAVFVMDVDNSRAPAPSRLTVSRYAADLARDASFGAGGIAAVDFDGNAVQSVGATPDGGYVFVLMKLEDDFPVVKLTEKGTLDTAFGAGGVAFLPAPTLDNITNNPAAASMADDGYVTIAIMEADRRGYSRMSLLRVQAAGDIAEFHNTVLDHYFMTYEGAEARGIDAGAAGPGWTRTGASFKPGGLDRTCRFYGTPGLGPNSHFYTVEPAECDAVRRSPGWTFEGLAFHTTRASSGRCPEPLLPIYRAYNDGWRTNDSNHRYMRDPALAAGMVARGWIMEGIAFCAKP